MGLGHLSGIELTDYLDGALPPRRVRPAERHLAACGRCRQALAGLRQAASAMEVVTPVAAPAGLREAVMAKLAAEPAPGLAPRTSGGLPCREAGALLHGYVDGELSPALVTSVQRHVRVCVRCRAELVVLTRMVGLLRSLRVLAPPAEIRESVWAARRLLPAPLDGPSLWSARLRPALALAAVGAAVLLMTLIKPAPRPTEVAMNPAAVSLPPVTAVEETRSSPSSGAAEPRPIAESGVTTADTHNGTVGESSEGATSRSAGPPAPRSDVTVAVRRGPLAQPVTVLPSRGGEYAMRASPETSSVPSAVLTLKAIASAAVGESGAQRRMAVAGEPFATLDSETRLARPPQAGPAAAGGRTGAVPAPAGTGEERPAGAGAPSGSGNDRADVLHGFGPWA